LSGNKGSTLFQRKLYRNGCCTLKFHFKRGDVIKRKGVGNNPEIEQMKFSKQAGAGNVETALNDYKVTERM